MLAVSRTLKILLGGLLLLTLFCSYLGLEYAKVQRRQAVRLQIKQWGGATRPFYDPDDDENYIHPPDTRLSPLRRLMGDHYVGYVSLPIGSSQETVKLIQDAFPEADIRLNFPPK